MNLRKIIKENGFTYSEVAIHLKITKQNLNCKLNRIFLGKNSFSRKEIKEICTLLNLDLKIFFD